MKYRVCWSASSNISFRGEGEWYEANPGESTEEVEENFGHAGKIGDGLELALSESGFEWWIEVRDA